MLLLGGFSSDAIQTLLGNLTDLKFAGKLVVIIAGYEHEVSKLLDANPVSYAELEPTPLNLSMAFTQRIELCVIPTLKHSIPKPKLSPHDPSLPPALYARVVHDISLPWFSQSWSNA